MMGVICDCVGSNEKLEEILKLCSLLNTWNVVFVVLRMLIIPAVLILLTQEDWEQ